MASVVPARFPGRAGGRKAVRGFTGKSAATTSAGRALWAAVRSVKFTFRLFNNFISRRDSFDGQLQGSTSGAMARRWIVPIM